MWLCDLILVYFCKNLINDKILCFAHVWTVILYYFSLRTMRLCLSNGFVSFSFVRMDNINNTNHLHTRCAICYIFVYTAVSLDTSPEVKLLKLINSMFKFFTFPSGWTEMPYGDLYNFIPLHAIIIFYILEKCSHSAIQFFPFIQMIQCF